MPSELPRVRCHFRGCGKDFASPRTLCKHKKTHAQNIKCPRPGCFWQGATKAQLRAHKDGHANIRKFKCTSCDKAFRTKDGLRKHVKYSHESPLPIKCAVCSYTTSIKHNMTRHVRQHERGFRCGVDGCSQTFGSRDSLHTHLANVHKLCEELECPFAAQGCRYTTRVRRNLQYHLTRHKKRLKRGRDGDHDALPVAMRGAGPDLERELAG